MWEPEFLADGETPTASKINTIMSGARDYVNDLDRYALRRGAVNRIISPHIIPAGTPAVVQHSATSAHTYSDAVFLASLRYNAIGTNGGAASGVTNTGDRAVIGHNSSGGAVAADATISLNSGTGYTVDSDGSSSSMVKAIYCMFNCAVINVVDPSENVLVMMCLQYLNGSTWYTLPHTERWVDVKTRRLSPTTSTERVGVDVPIRTLITEEDTIERGSGNTIQGVRAMVSLEDSTATNSVLHLGSFRLSVVPLLCSVTASRS